MKLSLAWLREFVDVDLPVARLARLITDGTAEVEGWESLGSHWDRDRIRVAEVVDVQPHPNADSLVLATVETGGGPQTVVCGAPNVAAGQKVAFATEGAQLIDGKTGQPAKLRLRPIRGVDSAGMVLSEKELGLGDNHEGILVLPADAQVGRSLVDQLGDTIFEVSTWANRADLLGVLGLAREVAALTGRPLREPHRAFSRPGADEPGAIAVTIEDPDLCRRFTATVVRGIRVGPSPGWMQERLNRHGMRPINNVVDITNYVMLETGQPLHAFDYNRVRGREIVARRARPGERLFTIDGVERELTEDMLLICDGAGPTGIAGIMGGGASEVSETTTDVLLEVANFKPTSIRRTSSRLKLRTEASLRFEKGIGPAMAEYARDRALHLLEREAGGRVTALVDVYPGQASPTTIALTRGRLEQVLGLAIPDVDVDRILRALGFSVRATGSGFAVEVAPWRPDVEIADDLIEEVARVYGYDRLPTTRLRGELPEVPSSPLESTREQLRDSAVGLGFQEVITYTLTEREKLALVTAPGDSRRGEPIAAANPVAAQHTYLRTSLWPSLLEAFATNRRHAGGPLRLFEIGFEYLAVEADLPHERLVACMIAGGPPEGRWTDPDPAMAHLDFYDLSWAAESLLAGLHVEPAFEPVERHGLLAGHTASLVVGGEEIGMLGQVHPELATNFGIEEPVFLCELAIEDVVRHLPQRPPYAPVSRFPEVIQDIAVVVDESTPAGRVLAIAREPRLVAGAEVFDDYRGPGIPAGKRSLGIRVRYQAPDRTLTDADVARVQQGIVRRLERELGASLRGG